MADVTRTLAGIDHPKASRALVAMAVEVARIPSLKRPRNKGFLVDNAMIPWELIEDLRTELDRLGYGQEWRERVR